MTVQPSPIRMARRATALLLGALVAPAAVWVAPAGALPDYTRVPVRYDLTGSGLAGYITYQTTSGQSHATNAPLPWSIQLTGWKTNASHPNPYSLSAQSVGPGTLTCTVTIDGKVVSQNTATGDPARVLCAYHGPPPDAE